VDFAQPIKIVTQDIPRVGRYPRLSDGAPGKHRGNAGKQLPRVGGPEVREDFLTDRPFLVAISPRMPDAAVGQYPYPRGVVPVVLRRQRFQFGPDFASQVPFQLLFGRFAVLAGLRLVRPVGETGGLGFDEQSPPG